MKRSRMTALMLAVSMACSLPAVYGVQAEEAGPNPDENAAPVLEQTEETAGQETEQPAAEEGNETDPENQSEPAEQPAETEKGAAPEETEKVENEAETAAPESEKQAEPEAEEAAADGEASVNDQVYSTLQEAINAAADGAVVTVNKDITLTKTITIPQGKNVTLALSGHHLNGNGLNISVLTVAGSVNVQGEGFIENGLNGINVTGGSVVLGNNVQIINNGAKSTGGNGSAIQANNGNIEINGALIQGNYSKAGGGAITMTNTNCVINDGQLIGNSSYSGCGGIFYTHGSLTMNGGTISNNSCIAPTLNSTYYRPTGGISEHGKASLNINGGTISGNKGSYVGAIFANSNVDAITISNVLMTENVGGLSGGLVTDAYTTVNITGGTYTNNSTDNALSSFWYPYGDGGAIAVTGGGGEQYGELHISGTADSPVVVTGNSNQGSGGGIFIQGNLTTTISGNVIVTDNYAGTIGGGVRLCDSTNVTAIDAGVIICNNTAKDSGNDIASSNDAPLTINATAPDQLLTTNGEPQRQITGWFYDGSPKIDGVEQTDPRLWSVNPDNYYAQEFTTFGQPVGSIGLRAAYTLQVNVLLNMTDEQGNVLDSRNLETLPAMSEYDITDQIPETFKDAEGHTWKLTTVPADAKGTVSTTDLTVDAVYEKVSLKVSHTPVDKDGNPIDEPQDILMDLDPGTEYDVTDKLPQALEKDGTRWKLKEVPENARGTTEDHDIMLYPVYEQIEPDVILEPVDENGDPIGTLTTVITDGKPGDAYDIKDQIPETIKSGEETYRLKETPTNASGTIGEEDITVKPVYEKVTVSVSIQPLGPEGSPISEPVPEVTDGNPGQDYDVTKDVPETITDKDGNKWILDKVEDNAKGKLGEDNVVVKAWYKKAPAPAKPSKPAPSTPSKTTPSKTSVSKSKRVYTGAATGAEAAASAGLFSVLAAWVLKRRNRNK